MQTRLHAKNGVIGEGVKFERIRRVTGYLVGTLDRFNDGKRAEEAAVRRAEFRAKIEAEKAAEAAGEIL